ncbi:transcriptional regulator IFH1 [Cynara cardunculus var. scolymus]|uniref:transcriptional regulator IFH1 n=1 Tax=Cynara cardunculus var. scolymus TaxID=59895 RepID=UPI000D62D570|nr:transcriptional regulator IFH1 [Cynara cardunculus var. scolymus]
MMVNDTFTAKWSDKRMEEDEGLRTVECLRGRLLAERAASKAANEESEQIAKKVIELEKQLKVEIKSRNKAEKRLKFLMKKLESLKISYVSADESSSFSEKSEISSVSSSSKSQDQMELQKTQFRNTSKFSTEGNRRSCPSQEENLGSVDESISGNSNENVIQNDDDDDDDDDDDEDDAVKKDGLKFSVTKNNINDEGHNTEDIDDNVDNSMALTIMTSEHDTDRDDGFDNSMALVVVENVIKEEKQDVPISNGNVKDVLHALRYAKESLQRSLAMRQHLRSNIACGRFLLDLKPGVI